MKARPFTPLGWSKVAGIPLELAQEFAADLVAAGLATETNGRYALTPTGRAVVRSVASLEGALDDERTEAAGPRSPYTWARHVPGVAPPEEEAA